MLALPEYPVRQRDFLLEISRAITAQLELSEVLKRVLHASTVMLTGRVAFVALRNEEDNAFQIRAIVGVQNEHIPELNEKLQAIVASVQEGFDFDEINSKLLEMAKTIDDELKQSVAIPLIFAHEPLGLLIVFRAFQSKALANDLQILQSFANQAAIAVHNAQLYERIDHERRRLAATIQNSGDGVMILDTNLTILQVNRAFERMVGWVADDMIGLNQDDVIVWRNLEHGDIRDALDDGWPFSTDTDPRSETWYVEGDLVRIDDVPMSIGITYAPLFDAKDRLVNIIADTHDITNRRKAQEMQNVFISTISHELRTPVALIKGFAGTLLREDVQWDQEVVRESLKVIEEETDRLTLLIEDLLTTSKIQAEQKLSLNLVEVYLNQLAERALERWEVQDAQHEFVLSFPDDFPSVHADETRLRQVIDNLIVNAVKYSPDGGKVTVGGRFDEHDVVLFVRDEGIGISEEDQKRIFDRFYRVDDELTRTTQGTGLGLYLVQAIIDAHGGEIYVKSQPGQGATFYFTIPRSG